MQNNRHRLGDYNLLRPWLFALWLIGGPALAQAAGNSSPFPPGNWLTENNGTVVAIAPCGGEICGRIAGIVLDHPTDPAPLDWRGQPQCGDLIIKAAPAPTTDGTRKWAGTVTDPRNGNVYQATVVLDDAGNVRLHGYVGLPLLGVTQIWHPYAGALGPNCQMPRPG